MQGGPKSNDECPFNRYTEGNWHAEEKGEGDRKGGAEIGGTQPSQRAKESGQAPLELSVT